jgi:hypothetical protein
MVPGEWMIWTGKENLTQKRKRVEVKEERLKIKDMLRQAQQPSHKTKVKATGDGLQATGKKQIRLRFRFRLSID